MRVSCIAGLLVLVSPLVYGHWVVGVDAARWLETILSKVDNSHHLGSSERATQHGHGALEHGLNTRQVSSAPISGKNLTILPLGDSITNGFQSTDGNGYRLDLVQDLTNNTVNMIGSVHAGTMPDNNNEGHDGATIIEIASNATASLLLLPTVVLLMAGTNDMDKNVSTATAPDRLGALIDQIFAACPNTTVLVAQVTPSGKNTTEALILSYNAAIPGVVAQRANAGMRVAVVDMYDALSFPADFTDYLHPNDGGYKKMADAWYVGLQQADQMGWLVDEVPVVLPPTSNATALPSPTGRFVDGGNSTVGAVTGTVSVNNTMLMTTALATTTTAALVSTAVLPSTTAALVSITTVLAVASSTAAATSEGARGMLCGLWSPVAMAIGGFCNSGLGWTIADCADAGLTVLLYGLAET
ncbi:hypothetical protein MMC18_009098 [Xylographa bjoerkii]|nr:hypothetical protein [Xylographa bjoerkii]